MDTDQILILVDDTDKFLDYAKRKDCHTGKGLHHRAFVVCLFNNKGQILLQKRKHKLFDGFWDVTAISHPLRLPDKDESYQEAANRALEAEMGIEPVELINIGGFNYFAKDKDMCENEYCAVLTGQFDGDVHPNTDAVYEYKWMNKEDFIADCKDKPEIYAPWTILTAELLQKE